MRIRDTLAHFSRVRLLREHWFFALLAILYAFLLLLGPWGATSAGDSARLENNRLDLIEDGYVLPTVDPALFTPEPPYAEPSRRKLNINKADAWMLLAVPGIGEKLAERIIEYRDAHGGFIGIEELTRINGIGDALYEQLTQYLVVL